MTTTPTPTTNPTASARVSDVAAGLGALVWWSLTDTKITPDRMRAILSGEGADASVVPDIEQGGAVKRATREWSKGRGKAERFRAEVAQETSAGELTIGILRREQVAASEVRWVQVDRVVFDSISAAWLSKGATQQAADFVATADETRTHLDHQWIRPNVIQRGLAEAQACNLRDRGGVYFVPRQFDSLLDRLARIVAKIGSCHLDVVNVAATASSQTSIARGASAALKDDLGELLARVNGWAESARRVPESASAGLLAELADLKARADLYSDALSISLDDLQTAIEEAREEAERLLTGQPAREARELAKANPEIVAEFTETLSRLSADANGVILVPGDVARANAAPRSRYGWWAKGPGASAGAALGFSTRIYTVDGTRFIRFAPLAKASPGAETAETGSEAPEAPEALPQASAPAPVEEPAAPSVEPDPEPTPDVTVELDEVAGDLRERLANKSPAELREMYRSAVGEDPGKRSKSQMIEKLVKIAA